MKNKKIMMGILFLAIVAFVLFGIPNTVNAADTFSTEDGIVVKKIVDGFSNGNIQLDISNINLSSEGNYVWGISTNSSAENVSEWYSLGDINASKKTTRIMLTVQEEKILELLRKTDTAYLYIKDTVSENFIINALQLDLTLPPFYAFDYMIWSNNYYIIGGNTSSVERWNATTYNIKTAYYKFEKITDEALISEYRQALLEKKDLNTVFTISKETVENVENWTACTRDYSYPFTKIDKSKLPTDQGAYYLWIKAKDTDSKTIYGCLIVNIDGDGPKVENIRVVSPEEGTYNTPQTVTIRVHFNEAITATTVPTLKIKFGTSPERVLTNGTIKNNDYSYGNYTYIEYKYNIQDTDVGQLATVSYEGGDVKDTSGNSATLTCPVITGNAIKANTEGTETNKTDNQDKTNDERTSEQIATNEESNTTDTKVDPKTNEKVDTKGDSTTIKTKIPQTGEAMGVIIGIVAIICVGAVILIKYKKIDF